MNLMLKIGLLSLISMLLSCASPNRDSAEEKLRANDFSGALQDIKTGLSTNPSDINNKIGLLNIKYDSVSKELEKINELRVKGRFDDALNELDAAEKLGLSLQRFANVRNDIEVERRASLMLEEAKSLLAVGKKAQALRLIETGLRANPLDSKLSLLQKKIEAEIRFDTQSINLRNLAETNPITLEFRNAPLAGVIEAISKHAGINFILDKDLKQDTKVNVFLKQTRVEDAIDLILNANGLARRVIDPSTMLIYPNTPDKVREHQELIVRVFHLANSEAKTTAAFLRSMLKIKEPFIDERANFVAIREPSEIVALAEKLVALHDLSDAEVMLEVEILEVNSSRLTDIGINFPNNLSLTPLSAAGAATGLSVNDLLNLNRSRVGTSVSPLSINLRREVGDANVLANPRIRAKNREKAHIVIGDKVPVVTTSSSANGIVGQNINYLEVGLKLDVEPLVSPDEEVTLKIALEVSTITQQISTGNGGTAYQIGTRNATTTLRLRDGETQLLGGLITNSEKSSSARIPGLGDIPIIGRLFGSQQDNKTKNELILAITPRIIRAAPKPDYAQTQIWIGTEAMPKLTLSPDSLKKQNSISSNSNGASLSGSSQPPPPNKISSTFGSQIKPTLSWSPVNDLKVGEEFATTLSFRSGLPIRGIPMEIAYIPANIEIIEIIEGNLLRSQAGKTSFSHMINKQLGKISIGLLRGDGTSVTANGNENDLVTFRFRAIGPGKSTIELVNIKPIAANEPVTIETSPNLTINIK